MVDRKKLGKLSKSKGKRGEREVAEILRRFGYSARRGQQFSGNPDAPDVVSSFPAHIEVKRTESLSLYPAMEQAIADSGEYKPSVWHRRSGKDWLVIMRAEDLLALIDELMEI